MNQLSLFEDDDTTPLPLIVARQWGFPLQHHVVDGEYWYALKDWVAGLTGETDATSVNNLIRQYKSTLTADSVVYFKYTTESNQRAHKMSYTARDGKTYKVQFVRDLELYRIAAYLRPTSEREALKQIKDYLAAAGVLADEARRNPEETAALLEDVSDARAYRRLIKQGFSDKEAQQWIRVRRQQISQRKQITNDWKRRGAIGTDYGRLTNKVTLVATGKTARSLKDELGISVSPREVLSAAENAAIGVTEFLAGGLHATHDSQGFEELAGDIQDTSPILDAMRPELERAFSKRRGLPGGNRAA
jgi:hypothetical protein